MSLAARQGGKGWTSMITATDTGITIEPELYEVLADLAHTAPHWIVEAQPELSLFDTLQAHSALDNRWWPC